MTIQSNVISAGTEDDAFVFGDPNGYSRKVTGTIPPNKTHYEVEAEMPKPALYFENQLQSELQKNNLATTDVKILTIEQSTLKGNEQLVYTHQSPKA